MPICALCTKEKELKNSHTIPRSIFKKIYTDSGKGILIHTAKDTPIQKTQMQLASDLLCDGCEQTLSKEYEKYTLEVLRGQRGIHAANRLNGVDFKKVELFFISIIWRAAVSTLPGFNEINLNSRNLEALRAAVKSGTRPTTPSISVKLNKLTDDKNIFTNEMLKLMCIKPFRRRYKTGYSFQFIFEGFFIEVFVPRLNYPVRKQPGVIDASIKSLKIPTIPIFSIPEASEILSKGHDKANSGQHTLKDADWEKS